MKSLIYKIIGSFLIASILGCGFVHKDIQEALNNRRFILSQFKDLTISRSRGGGSILVYQYKLGFRNKYIFKKEHDGLTLIKDSLEFKDEKFTEDKNFKRNLELFFQKKINIMNSYNIKDVSREFASQGIEMKLYFNSQRILMYVPNPDIVKNQEWVAYLKSLNRFDAIWFYGVEK